MKKIIASLSALGPLAPVIVWGVLILGGAWTLYYFGSKAFQQFGAGAPDPGGGEKSTGVIDGVLNQTLEIGKSPENYTAATTETVLHPYDTIKSILGFSQTQ